MSDEKFSVAIVGATGAVGREMLNVLEERKFPVGEIRAVASSRSAGGNVRFGSKRLDVTELVPEAFDDMDFVLFAAGAKVSREFVPVAMEAGAIAIDNSSCFRMDPAVFLGVPEVNGTLLRDEIRGKDLSEGIVIANPNCSTIQLTVVLKPLLETFGIRRVVVSTYQSVSGAGQKGMDELWNQTKALFANQPMVPKTFQKTIAFNCIPQIDKFLDDGSTKEETKIIEESRKILGVPDLRITATAVRVPTFACHAESVNIELERPCTAQAARELLRQSPGLIVLDDTEGAEYPTGFDLVGTDATYVGRIRQDLSVPNGLNLWIVADNLRKGAALNAVQLAEIVLRERQSH